MCCRERFRILTVEGWKPEEQFCPRIAFGNLWHAAEESLAGKTVFHEWDEILAPARAYAAALCTQFPLDRDKVGHWLGVTETMFPLYFEYWVKHPDVAARTPLMQEQVFDVPYRLPSGRTVRLRGKFDSVDLIGKGKTAGIYLKENKTKSRIDQTALVRQLTFDLQVMTYMVALEEMQHAACEDDPSHELAKPIKGVIYNVVKRPEQRVGKAETAAGFRDRLAGIISASPGDWFMRWKVEVRPGDVKKFRETCLDPILENLCDWWSEVFERGVGGIEPDTRPPHEYADDRLYRTPLNWRHPFGVRNILDEGGQSDLDEFLSSGSTLGLRRVETLFPEL